MSHSTSLLLGGDRDVDHVRRVLSRHERGLWIAALVVMVADLLLTYYGIALVGLTEANPLARATLHGSGYAGLAAVKLLVLGVAAAGRAALPRGFEFVAPACLLGPWTLATAINVVAIFPYVV